MNTDLYKWGKYYADLGISAIVVGDKKLPVCRWKKFQDTMPTPFEMNEMACHSNARGMALMCGKVSGNLEVVDIDVKNSLETNLAKDYLSAIHHQNNLLLKKLLIIKTASGGYHLIYRCSEIARSKQLARRYTTLEERESNTKDLYRVLIETRGEGAYIATLPTKGYSIINGAYETIPVISTIERNTLISSATIFNKVETQEQTTNFQHAIQYTGIPSDSPLKDYDTRGDPVELLQRHGWKIVKDDGTKIYILRPGHTTSENSGFFDRENNSLKIFSTSTPFEIDRRYKPSAIFCVLECNNNFSDAAKQLLALGYGKSYLKIKTPKTIRRRK